MFWTVGIRDVVICGDGGCETLGSFGTGGSVVRLVIALPSPPLVRGNLGVILVDRSSANPGAVAINSPFARAYGVLAVFEGAAFCPVAPLKVEMRSAPCAAKPCLPDLVTTERIPSARSPAAPPNKFATADVARVPGESPGAIQSRSFLNSDIYHPSSSAAANRFLRCALTA